MIFIADADEGRQEVIETTQQLAEVNPWIVTPLAILAMVMLASIVHKIFKSRTATYSVALLELFFVGALTYSRLPVLGIICIVAGFLLSLITVFLGLGRDK